VKGRKNYHVCASAKEKSDGEGQHFKGKVQKRGMLGLTGPSGGKWGTGFMGTTKKNRKSRGV